MLCHNPYTTTRTNSKKVFYFHYIIFSYPFSFQSLRRRGRHLISRGSHKYTASSNMSQVDHEGNIIPKRKQSGSSTVMCEHYSAWATWSHCSRRCEQYRTRNCVEPRYCGNTTIKDKRFCKRRNKQCSILSFKVRFQYKVYSHLAQII